MAVVCAEDDVSVVRNEQQINADGSYQYAWETSNGINVQEQGSLKQVGESQAIVSTHLIFITTFISSINSSQKSFSWTLI